MYEYEFINILQNTFRLWKGILFRLLPLVPMLFIYVFFFPLEYYHNESGFYIGPFMMQFIFACISAVWLLLPIRKSCQNGLIRFLYFCVPFELLLTLLFSQYHPIWSLLLFAAPAISSVIYCISLRRKKSLSPSNKLQQWQRIVVLSSFAAMALPSFFIIFYYGFQPLL